MFAEDLLSQDFQYYERIAHQLAVIQDVVFSFNSLVRVVGFLQTNLITVCQSYALAGQIHVFREKIDKELRRNYEMNQKIAAANTFRSEFQCLQCNIS